MRKLFLFILSILSITSTLAQTGNKVYNISDDIEIIQLSDNVYLHRSFLQTQTWGKVGANGLILLKEGKAIMIDTPWNNEQTEVLYKWISDSLHVSTETVIPTHWHEDRMGGLAYLQSQDVESYANQQTIDLAISKGLPVPHIGFTDSLNINFHGTDLKLYYPGGGHTTDNIIVWIPSEDILFGGCFIKDLQSSNLGNLADADVTAWPKSIKNLLSRFKNTKTVIPGHGNVGGMDLLTHTEKLLKEKSLDR